MQSMVLSLQSYFLPLMFAFDAYHVLGLNDKRHVIFQPTGLGF